MSKCHLLAGLILALLWNSSLFGEGITGRALLEQIDSQSQADSQLVNDVLPDLVMMHFGSVSCKLASNADRNCCDEIESVDVKAMPIKPGYPSNMLGGEEWRVKGCGRSDPYAVTFYSDEKREINFVVRDAGSESDPWTPENVAIAESASRVLHEKRLNKSSASDGGLVISDKDSIPGEKLIQPYPIPDRSWRMRKAKNGGLHMFRWDTDDTSRPDRGASVQTLVLGDSEESEDSTGTAEMTDFKVIKTINEEAAIKNCTEHSIAIYSEAKQNGFLEYVYELNCVLNSGSSMFKIEKTILGEEALYVIYKRWDALPDEESRKLWLDYLMTVQVCDASSQEHSCPGSAGQALRFPAPKPAQ